jgi:hypothetical protein
MDARRDTTQLTVGLGELRVERRALGPERLVVTGAIYVNDMVIRIDIGSCSLARCYLFNGRMYAE